MVAPTLAPPIEGTSYPGSPSPYVKVLRKKRFPNDRTLRTVTFSLVPRPVAIDTLCCSKVLSLMRMSSGAASAPAGAITTPTTKR